MNRKTRNVRTVCVLLISGLVTSCNDFNMAIDYSHTELISLTELQSVIGNDMALPIVQKQAGNRFVIIYLKSDKNLWNVLEGTERVLHVESAICERPKFPVILGLPSVYSTGYNISTGAHISAATPKHLQDEFESKPYGYQIVLFESSQRRLRLPIEVEEQTGYSHYQSFDLSESNEEVCIRINLRSGSNILDHFNLRISIEY